MVSSRNRNTHAAPARRQGGELRGVLRVFGILLALLPGLAGVLFAEDWPTHRRDLQRSGVSPERLQLPLTQTWAYRSANPPAPAWTGPAKKNYYATNQVLLKSRLAFARAFHVAVAGDGLYFGSSVDDTLAGAIRPRVRTTAWCRATGATSLSGRFEAVVSSAAMWPISARGSFPVRESIFAPSMLSRDRTAAPITGSGCAGMMYRCRATPFSPRPISTFRPEEAHRTYSTDPRGSCRAASEEM